MFLKNYHILLVHYFFTDRIGFWSTFLKTTFLLFLSQAISAFAGTIIIPSKSMYVLMLSRKRDFKSAVLNLI